MIQSANSWEACRAASIMRFKMGKPPLSIQPGPEKAAA